MYNNDMIGLPLDDDDPFGIVTLDYIDVNNDINSNECDYHLMDRVAIDGDNVNDNFSNVDYLPVDESINNGKTFNEDEQNVNLEEDEEDDLQFTEIEKLLTTKSIGLCYFLNKTYCLELELFRDHLEEKLQANLDMQEELMNSETLANEHVYPNSLLKFLAPFFRDNKAFTPDDNDDTKSRRATGCINTFYLRLRKPWKDSDILDLRSAVQNYVTKKDLEPYTIKENRLLEELSKLRSQEASQEEINEKLDMLEALRSEIESVKSFSTLPPREQSDDIDWLEVSQNCPSVYNEFDCEIKWTNFEHPDINHNVWTVDEENKLKSLVNSDHPDWDKVAKELGTGRVAWQCCEKYQSQFNESLRGYGKFTREEKNLLQKLIEQLSVGNYIPWHQVAYFMESRNLSQIKHFWTKMTHCSRRGAKWTDLENKVLLAAVQKVGTRNWKSVANYIPGRTNMQCRERYMLRLRIKDRKLADWTFSEDLKLVSTAPSVKFRWVDMMAHLTKRNPRQIAARYDTIEKCKIEKAIETSKDLRDLVPRNKSFGKRNIFPGLELHLEEGQTLDDFLREGKKELENRLKNDHYRPKVTRPGVGGRKKKPENEELLEQELVRRFSDYSLMGKTSKQTQIARAGQETMLFDVLKTILNDYFSGKLPNEPHLLANVISSVLTKQAIGVNPTRLNYCPPIFPPNIVTTQSFQVFLFMRQRLKKQLTAYNFDTSQYFWDQHYRMLLGLIISLYFWPCLLSKHTPISTKSPSDSSLASPSPSSLSSSSSIPSAKKSSKRRKKSQPLNIDHCNDIREKQRRLFAIYEQYLSKFTLHEN